MKYRINAIGLEYPDHELFLYMVHPVLVFDDCFLMVLTYPENGILGEIGLESEFSGFFPSDISDGTEEYKEEDTDGYGYDEIELNDYYSFGDIEERDSNFFERPTETEKKAEPILICKTKEIIFHEHIKKCFDRNGNLICGRIQVLEHKHNEDCFEEYQIPIDTETITCGLEEDENHTHTLLCCGTWELVCELEEHTHTKECQPDLHLEETEPIETEPIETEPVETEPTETESIETGPTETESIETEPTETESIETEPTETESIETEPIETEPIETEPIETEPIETEPIETEPIETEPIETEPIETEPIETEPIETEPVETEPIETEPIETEPVETEPIETEPIETEPIETEPIETEPVETEPIETEPIETEPVETEPIETEPIETESIETEPIETEPVETETDGAEGKTLSDDSAYISLISEIGAEILTDRTDADSKTKVVSGDTVLYNCLIDVKSYSEDKFTDGRTRVELVLPFTEDQAVFDLSYMEWFDCSEEYELSVSTETRTINDTETSCQILNGYMITAIPAEAEIIAAVRTISLPDDSEVYLMISTIMEFNTWDGICDVHQTEEKLTITTKKYSVKSEQQVCYEQFRDEIEALGTDTGNTDEIRKRIEDAFSQGKLSEEDYKKLLELLEPLTVMEDTGIAEAADGDNWKTLRDSGWFEEYSGYSYGNHTAVSNYASNALSKSQYSLSREGDGTPSAVQIDNKGGSNASDDGAVTVSKTIAGTELENVFDITLNVQTSLAISEISQEPDIAVVIVMDISNTMNSDFSGVTRYAAAMTAAEAFLDQFAANNSLGISKVGYVAFNTNAHRIFDLQSCSTQAQANSLKNTMRTQTGNIINNYTRDDKGNINDHNRFTNIEAGLAMASDMLKGVSNQNKYIIFLSDGFPTTYIQSGYSGYDTYDTTGSIFYDHVLKKKCLYGTSYSDEAAIRARKKAAEIKGSGTTIFSIGVDVAGQTIQKYITQSEEASGFSVVERTGTTYEIGDASSTEAYKNWLRNSIGSGYYYDSTDSTGLSNAYQQIFERIKHEVEAGSQADWVASDPIPTISGSADTVEFIGFYDQNAELTSGNLTGNHVVNGENTAAFISDNYAISWDLKKSGYLETTSGSTTTYTYTLVYRVRLKNESESFVENQIYPTNDPTTLQYRTISVTDGSLTVSDPKTVEFQIPSVHGFLTELTFQKTNPGGILLSGAEFTLIHDDSQCGFCRGDGTSCVNVQDFTAVSDNAGKVVFSDIPSGHTYILRETKAPDGFRRDDNTYKVTVAYNEINVTAYDINGNVLEWNWIIVNQPYYELPSTGGSGVYLYTIGGMTLSIVSAVLLLYIHSRRRRGDRRNY